MFLSPPQSLFCSCNLPHFISRQTPLKTSDLLMSCHLCDDQMSRLGGEPADIYEDHGSNKRKKNTTASCSCPCSCFSCFCWAVWAAVTSNRVKGQSWGRPLRGAYTTPERQDFVDDVRLVYLQHVVLAFAKIYLHIFLSYIDNIKSELYTENRCGDWDIFYRLC